MIEVPVNIAGTFVYDRAGFAHGFRKRCVGFVELCRGFQLGLCVRKEGACVFVAVGKTVDGPSDVKQNVCCIGEDVMLVVHLVVFAFDRGEFRKDFVHPGELFAFGLQSLGVVRRLF